MQLVISHPNGKHESIRIKRFGRRMNGAIQNGLHAGGEVIQTSVVKKISKGGTHNIVGKSPYPDLRSRTGRLMGSIKLRPTNGARKSREGYSVEVGTNVKYARIHEYGGMTGANHATRIPARPYWRPTIKRVYDKVVKEIKRHIKRAAR